MDDYKIHFAEKHNHYNQAMPLSNNLNKQNANKEANLKNSSTRTKIKFSPGPILFNNSLIDNTVK